MADFDGAVQLRQLTVSALVRDGQASIPLFTAAAWQLNAAAALEQITVTGDFALTSFEGAVELLPLTAEGTATLTTAFDGSVIMPALTAQGTTPDYNHVVMEALTASGEHLPGGVWDAAATLLSFQVSGESDHPHAWFGAVSFEYQTARAQIDQLHGPWDGVVTLRAARAAGTHTVGGVWAGAPHVSALSIQALWTQPLSGDGATALMPPTVQVSWWNQPAATYRTYVMNAKHGAVTQYDAHNFNGYATQNGEEFASGPSGIYKLSGDTDNGVEYNGSMRSGFLSLNEAQLSRLNEVLLAIRTDDTLILRVWTDEEEYFDYALPAYNTDGFIRQMRVKLGKGLRSRYYRIEITGRNGARWDLDEMNIDSTALTRRVG